MPTPDISVPRAPAGPRLRAASIALLALLGACAAPGAAPDADQAVVEVARAESAVKLALIEAGDVDAAAVGVAADDTTVTLDGFVASEAEREAVLRAAREAADGLEVIDALEVR